MKQILIVLAMCFPILATAQFTGTQQKGGLTVIVSDGTDGGKNSPKRPPGNAKFKDPIRALGMVEAIQAAAFLVRPDYGKVGFILIFCVNDSVGGKQGELYLNGQFYKGVYRLIRQRLRIDEETPEGMTDYRLEGTVFFLGIS